MKTFCLFEENDNARKLLGLLLSINNYEKNSTCVINCKKETKEYILNFPKKLSIKLDFNIQENKLEKFNVVFCLQNMIKALEYTLNNYENCIFVYNSLVMTNPIEIPKEIEEQGFGFIKKNGKMHTKEDEYKLYNFELFYISDVKYLENIVFMLGECDENGDFMSIDADKIDSNIEFQKKVFEIYKNIPYKIAIKNKNMCFLSNNELVATEDFFAYENSIEPKDISKDWKIKENPISFVHIRLDEFHPQIQDFNKNMLSSLSARNVIYMSILNLMFSKNKLEFLVPEKNGVGIWDRNEAKDSNGLYRLTNGIKERNGEYFGIVETNKVDYFSFGNHLIMDKPSKYWLNNGINKYSSVLLCNYDDSMLEVLKKEDKKYEFLCYICEYPEILEDYLDKKERKGENVDFEKLIKKTEEMDMCDFEQFDTQKLALCLALGTIPVIPEMVQKEILDLEEGVHYLRKKEEDVDLDKMRENCKKYYEENMKIEKIIKKLMDYVFVGRV